MDHNDLKKKWNRLASLYDYFVSTEENTYNEIKRKIIDHINYEDKILELASGSGRIALDLCPHCKYIEASDISTEMIQRANLLKSHSRYQNISFDVQDVCAINADNDTYDVIILSNALHILPHPDHAMNEIKRVLKPGGKLIAPNYLHNQSRGALMISKLISAAGYPSYTRFDEDSYHAYVRSHNFKIRHATIIPGRIPLSYVEATLDDEPEFRANIILK